MATYVDFGDRLRAERQRLGLKQADVAQAGGVSKTSQVNYENGLRVPDAAYLSAVSSVGIDPLYIVTGRHADRDLHPSTQDDDLVHVPILQVAAAAGHGAVNEAFAEYKVGAGVGFSQSWLSRRGLAADQLRIIEVRGASMAGVLADGDRVLVNLLDTHPRSGFVYVLRQGEELLVKYCQVLPGGVLRISSADPAFAPYDVDLSKAADVTIVGRVVASMHEW